MTQLIDPPAAAPANGKTELAKREFQPLAPVGSAGGLKALLDTQRNSIAGMLPKHITPERLFKTLLVAANRNPDLLKCTQSSVLETINRAAELGLDLSGTLGEAYPVPFNNKVKTRDGEAWLMQCQLIIGYRGLEKLAWQSGEVESIDAEVVCKNDTFKFRKGTEVFVEWAPCLDGDRGEVVGAYACVKLKSGGKLARFLPKSDIDKIRNTAKSKDSPAWRNWWEEMARKCALKRVLKDAPLSTEKYVKVMEHEEPDFGMADVVEAQTQNQRGVAALNASIRKQQPQLDDTRGQTFEQETDPAHAHPDESQAPVPQQSAAGGAPPAEASDRGSGDEGADPDAEHSEPPADPAREEFERWLIGMQELAEAKDIDAKDFPKLMRKVFVKLGVVGREWTMTPAQRADVAKAIKEREGYFA